jgi:hypothetical protein
MTEAERRAFWEGYMAGDGCRTSSSWHFDSVSRSVVDGIQALSMSLGYGCRLVSYDCMKAGRTMINPQGRTYTTKQSFRGHVLRKKPVAHVKKTEFKTVELDEMVYCVTVPSGFFLARTNGKPFIAKNCDGLRYLVMNVFAPKGKFAFAADPSFENRNDLPGMAGPDRVYDQDGWMRQILSEKLGTSSGSGESQPPPGVVKSGRFHFDI